MDYEKQVEITLKLLNGLKLKHSDDKTDYNVIEQTILTMQKVIDSQYKEIQSFYGEG